MCQTVSLTGCVVGADLTRHFPISQTALSVRSGSHTFPRKMREEIPLKTVSDITFLFVCLFGEGKPFGPAHTLTSFNFIFGAAGVSQEEISNWPEHIWLCMASETRMTHAYSMSSSRNTQGILYTTEEADMLGLTR